MFEFISTTIPNNYSTTNLNIYPSTITDTSITSIIIITYSQIYHQSFINQHLTSQGLLQFDMKKYRELAWFGILIIATMGLGIEPTWVRDNSIDAGQVKVVNMDVLAFANPNSTINSSKPYTKTDFGSTPRVTLGMIGFGIAPTTALSTTTIGYRFIITAYTPTSFSYTATFYGVKCVGLHFQYIAISGYTNYYYLQNYWLNFTSNDTIYNSTPTTTRSQSLQLNNPQGMINDGALTNGDVVLQAFPMFFLMSAENNKINYNLTTALFNSTSFTVHISTGDKCSIQQFGISVISVNKTKILYHNFSHIIDYSSLQTIGNSTPYVPTYTTITDFNTQYMYRNNIMGTYALYFPITILALNIWYFNISTSASSINTGKAIQQRMRQCNVNTSLYFMYQDFKCHPSCPTHYFTNTTAFFCFPCHYSCSQCDLITISGCTLCYGVGFRTLGNHSCSCNPHYYDNNTLVCLACHYTCYTCSGQTISECLSCDSSNSFRNLINSTYCVCQQNGYFQNNTFICASCHYTCKTCLNQLNTSCSSCDSFIFRVMNNVTSSCICFSNYYENITCIVCPNNCMTCQYLSSNQTVHCLSCNATDNRQVNVAQDACICTSSSYLLNSTCQLCSTAINACLQCHINTTLICTSCNSSRHFIVTNGTCSCNTAFAPNGSECISTIAICGNGILEPPQTCDDNNTNNADGCSSTCTIQPNHDCINNISLYTFSLCYYITPVSLSVLQIYKFPLQNKVRLDMQISAPSCNAVFLQQYLQTQTSIQLVNNNRLLLASEIVSQTVSYNAVQQLLTVQFSYNQNIDLTTKTIKFIPSLALSHDSIRYFYSSPTTSITLHRPSNLLLTTYSSAQQISTTKNISYAFLSLIILTWAFIFAGAAYSQSALAVQAMLLLQLTYQSLLQSGFINDGWIGIILYGRYTYGYNYPFQPQSTYDSLQILSLNAHLINTLNATLGLVVFAVFGIGFIFIYETVKHQTQADDQENATQAKIDAETLQNSNRNVNRQNQEIQTFQIKKFFVLFFMQILFSLMFLTVKPLILSLMFISPISQITTTIPSILLTLSYIIAWYIYYRTFDYQFLKDFSYRRLLRQPDNTNHNIHCSFKFGNFIVKYYYPIIFICLILFAVLDGLTIISGGLYIIVIVGSVMFAFGLFMVQVYFRRVHMIRALLNLGCLIVIMVLQLLQSLEITNSSQNFVQPIIGLSVLFVTLFCNFAIFVRIQYKRHKKPKRSSKIGNANVIIMGRNQTEQPEYHPEQKLQFELIDNNRHKIDHSHEVINKQQKFQNISDMQRSNQSYSQTNKKLAIVPNDLPTNQKELIQPFENLDGTMAKFNPNSIHQQQEAQIQILSISNNFQIIQIISNNQPQLQTVTIHPQIIPDSEQPNNN